MIKLIPCNQMEKVDILKALADGRRFVTEPALIMASDMHMYTIHFDAKHGKNPIRCGTELWKWTNLPRIHEITESHWYDNIPEDNPALCKVSDEDGEFKLDYIIEKTECGYFVAVSGKWWDKAELITAADLYEEPV